MSESFWQDLLQQAQQLMGRPDFWKHASIPFVAAVVGWATNWVAVKLTFLPLEFVGIRPFLGWQGIIPSKAEKMATTFVDSTMSRLGTLRDVFDGMDPRKIGDHVVRYLERHMDDYTDEVMAESNPVLWETLPSLVKQQAYAGARRGLPRIVRSMMQEIGDRIEELIDFKHMIVSRLVDDRALLNRLFQESGAKEFQFIIRSGFHFGFLFGLVQLGVWILLPAWWVLPLFGLIVGWATNWIALNLIFRPLEPVKVGPWTVQGLFLKRQTEVAAVWCHLVTRNILTARQLMTSLMHGPRSELSRKLVIKHSKPIVDEAVGLVKPAAQFTVGLRGYADIRTTVGEKALDLSTVPFDDPVFNEGRAQVIEGLLRERMEAMPPAEFQDLLRPCFQEDEWKLILTGAVLGALAGFAQLVFVFGGGG